MIPRLLVAFLSLGLTSCSWVMCNTIPKRPPLKTGTHRDEVISVLGKPRHTIVFSPAGSADSPQKNSAVPAGTKARSRDEYFVSELVQLPTDPYAGESNVYPAFFIVTGGLIELVAFPVTLVDLTWRGLRWRHLWLWYDSSGNLIAYRRR